MRFKSVLLVLVLFTSCKLGENGELSVMGDNIIPIPKHLELSEGHFILGENTTIIFDPELAVASNFFQSFLQSGAGIKMSNDSNGNVIRFQKDTDIVSSEGYRIEISKDSLSVYSSSGVPSHNIRLHNGCRPWGFA